MKLSSLIDLTHGNIRVEKSLIKIQKVLLSLKMRIYRFRFVFQATISFLYE